MDTETRPNMPQKVSELVIGATVITKVVPPSAIAKHPTLSLCADDYLSDNAEREAPDNEDDKRQDSQEDPPCPA
jgi:hypothetical protein